LSAPHRRGQFLDERKFLVPQTLRDRDAPHHAETLYDLEMECRRQGWGADPALIYDEKHNVFRFRDGRFAFSRHYVNRELLEKRGRLRWME